jgi:hypothetical protein
MGKGRLGGEQVISGSAPRTIALSIEIFDAQSKNDSFHITSSADYNQRHRV